MNIQKKMRNVLLDFFIKRGKNQKGSNLPTENTTGSTIFLIKSVFFQRFNKSLIFSEEQLCHLVADLFGAGLDTTLTTLKWALLYLASYPETQELIRTEIGKLNEQKLFLTESDLPQTAVSKIY